jgi:cytochrome c peroxidase
LFNDAFGSPEVTRDRIAQSLAQFLRSIVSYRSKFDEAHAELAPDYYTDPSTVLSPLELRGMELFSDSRRGRCRLCHTTAIQFLPRYPSSFEFDTRVATLRNIALTAPYMPDGSFPTLRSVIERYFGPDGLLGEAAGTLTDEEKGAIEAFLNTLTDHTLNSDPRFSDPFAN